MVPKTWFTSPLFQSMSKLVRPATARTRRKMLTIKQHTIKEVLFDLMADLETGEVEGLEWTDSQKKELRPTSETASLTWYKYTINKPGLVDKIWKLQDREVLALKGSGKGQQTLCRRGHGCARLHLSRAAAQRGQRSDLIAQVTDRYRERRSMHCNAIV
ncbi:hypothetical protein AB1Y20_010810 [Prymnesium parvum]|uniref:Uncharacterized protein n=1 Tax=Prymnesium parvum TaxID=97485 RepID=A0AB34ISD1_PRYPA